MDYGEICLKIHTGLSIDQKLTMIKLAVENQLFPANRRHYIEILNHCYAISKILDDGVPFTNEFNNFQYKYKFKIEYITHPTKRCYQGE